MLILGSLLVSLAFAYAWWCKVRVVRLRQDLFDIRDALFDKATEFGALSDPGYRAARRHVNAIAGFADAITIPALMFALHRGVRHSQQLRSERPELQPLIDGALERCADRVVRYLLRETFTGVVFLPILRLVRVGTIMEVQTKRWLQRVLSSDVPERFMQFSS